MKMIPDRTGRFRQRPYWEKQFAGILAKLPDWAASPIQAINITGWRVNAVLSRRKIDVVLENGFPILDREASKNRTAYKWPLIGELGELVRGQLERIALDERRLRRLIPSLFHHKSRPIPYAALYDAWREAANAAGHPGKLMHDFRRRAATRLDSAPGISCSVAMTLLGHKTDIMFRRYIQRPDERLIEAKRWPNSEHPSWPTMAIGTRTVTIG